MEYLKTYKHFLLENNLADEFKKDLKNADKSINDKVRISDIAMPTFIKDILSGDREKATEQDNIHRTLQDRMFTTSFQAFSEGLKKEDDN